MLFPFAAHSNGSEPHNKDLQGLLNWAVYLSEYEAPAALPALEIVDHDFLELHACLGQPCDVIGWYNDQNVIYIDKAVSGLNSMLERSIVVHELVHFLQHKSGKYSTDCADTVAREREAYEIQRRFFYAYGALSPIRMHEHHCAPQQPANVGEQPAVIQSQRDSLNDMEKQQISSSE